MECMTSSRVHRVVNCAKDLPWHQVDLVELIRVASRSGWGKEVHKSK